MDVIGAGVLERYLYVLWERFNDGNCLSKRSAPEWKMQTPILRLLRATLSTGKNKDKGSILYWSFFTVLKTWRPFSEEESYQPRRPQLPTRVNYLPNSTQGFFCRNHRNFLGIATWVLQGMTVRRQNVQVSCYNALIAARCRQGHLMEARRLLDVMKKSGCEPSTDSYNYLLGTICKKGKIADACHLLDLMEKSGHRPNPITYEILICHACKTSKMDSALEFVNKMIADGLRPRYSTYAAFIKGYFYNKEFEEAYNFVIETSKKDPSSNSMNYMLLASLFEKSGMVLEARNVLLQMIEKGLIPSFSLCKKISTSLFQNGNQVMAEELLCRYGDIRNALNKKQNHHEK